MAGKLTPRQRKFTQQVAAGKSHADAIRAAYPKSRKWKGNSVRQAAARLMRMPHVRSMIAALRSETAQSCAMSREEYVRRWQDVLSRSNTLYDEREALKGIGVALGYDEPAKLQVSVEERTLIINVLPPSADELAEIEERRKAIETIEVKSLPPSGVAHGV